MWSELSAMLMARGTERERETERWSEVAQNSPLYQPDEQSPFRFLQDLLSSFDPLTTPVAPAGGLTDTGYSVTALMPRTSYYLQCFNHMMVEILRTFGIFHDVPPAGTGESEGKLPGAENCGGVDGRIFWFLGFRKGQQQIMSMFGQSETLPLLQLGEIW